MANMQAGEQIKQISSTASLLGQALDVPSLDDDEQSSDDPNDTPAEDFILSPASKSSAFFTPAYHQQAHTKFNGGILNRHDFASDNVNTLDASQLIIAHSDFTIPTSNMRDMDSSSPPPETITPSPKDGRRNLFGSRNKYAWHLPSTKTYQETTTATPPRSNTQQRAAATPRSDNIPIDNRRTTDPLAISDYVSSSPPDSPPPSIYSTSMSPHLICAISPLTPHERGRTHQLRDIDPDANATPTKRSHKPFHENIHAQSLLLGLAFMAVWSPNNAMAPNLTEIAVSFGMDGQERDLYLGSYCALALGVFSLPISALIGILTDFYPRKYLFVVTVAGGAIASAATGLAPNFHTLFLARLVNGGLMSGSVPVAFSLLGDLFATEERNAASSGLTAMMGLGIVMGQVYAGMVGSSKGWPHTFFVSSIVTLISAVMVLVWVREPIRGGKEKVLQDMIKSGAKYRYDTS
jgi:hypothetical protein